MEKSNGILLVGALQDPANYTEGDLVVKFKDLKPILEKKTSICCTTRDIKDATRNALHTVGFDLVLSTRNSGAIIKAGPYAILYLDVRKFAVGDLDLVSYSAEISAARDSGAKKVIAYVQWEKETSNTPSAGTKEIAATLMTLDIDIIIGTNGSRIQPYSDKNHQPVFYSIGGLLTNESSKQSRTAVILSLELDENGLNASYLPCYTMTQFAGAKGLVVPINNKKYYAGKTNQLMKEQKLFAQAVIGKQVPVTDAFNQEKGAVLTADYVYPPYYAEAGVDPHDVYTGSIFMEKRSEVQEQLLQAYRTTDAFKKSYGNYILSNNPDGEGVQEAIRLIKRFKKLDHVTIETHRDLIVDMLYMRNIFGFYCIEYFRYEFENKTLEERLGYIPDRSIIPYFDALNRDRDAFKMMRDKYKLYQHLKPFYRRDAMHLSSEDDKEEFINFVKKHPRFIAKPEAALQARGVYIHDLKNFADEEALFAELMKIKPLICEELIIQDEKMAAFHPRSVNCMRIFTYCNGVDAKMIVALLKTGAGGDVVDNGVRGGLAAGVDIKTGIVFTDAYNKHGENTNEEFLPQHPDTGVTFKGFQIPKWDELGELAENAAKAMPTTPIIAWDIALSTEGWKIVEGNGHGAMFLYQTVTKQGVMKLFLEECEFDRYKGK